MPKKLGVNSKAEAAKARKSAVEGERKERETREKEEQYWREAEGPKSRAAKKREDESEKRAEAVARKVEARRLAEQEEKELEKALKKPDKKASRVAIPVPKVTEVELRKRREEEQAELERKAEEAKKKQSRTAAEEEYERMVLVANTNRDDSIIEARTVEDAIAQIAVSDNLPVDKHPERRLKAAFKAFEEAELPILKEEKPGLTHNQYKDMIWKLWKKSPDNPLNQSDYIHDLQQEGQWQGQTHVILVGRGESGISVKDVEVPEVDISRRILKMIISSRIELDRQMVGSPTRSKPQNALPMLPKGQW